MTSCGPLGQARRRTIKRQAAGRPRSENICAPRPFPASLFASPAAAPPDDEPPPQNRIGRVGFQRLPLTGSRFKTGMGPRPHQAQGRQEGFLKKAPSHHSDVQQQDVGTIYTLPTDQIKPTTPPTSSATPAPATSQRDQDHCPTRRPQPVTEREPPQRQPGLAPGPEHRRHGGGLQEAMDP
jgi:hypothetical protein